MKCLLTFVVITLLAPACSSIPEYPYPRSTVFLETDGEVLTSERIVQLQQSIGANYEKWKAAEPRHYTYIIAQSCYCLYGPSYGPNEIEVIDGEVERVTYRGEIRDGYRSGQKISDQRAIDDTIEQLFEKANRVLKYAMPSKPDERRRGVPRFLIEYDNQYNFPMKVAFDDPTIADEEWVVVIENMTVLN